MHNGLGHPRLKPSYIVSNRMVLVAMEVNSYFGMKYKKIKIKYSLVSAGIENCEQPVTPGIGGGGGRVSGERSVGARKTQKYKAQLRPLPN